MGEVKEDQGVAASPPGHQPTASAADASSQSGVPNAEMPLAPWFYHEHGTRGSISKAEFCARFKAYMLKAGDTFDDGSSIAEYADEAAVAYWEDNNMTQDGPEACAAADMDYWGE